MKKLLKKLAIALLVIFILIQFYPRPEKNISNMPNEMDITKVYRVPAEVAAVLKTSCYDCHSNNTVYPWYASIQPIALWLDDHIKEGKAELNFSEFGSYQPSRQYRKLEEIADEVEENEMPLSSYTIIHRNAKLNADQKQLISGWVKETRHLMESSYSKDELTKRRK